MNQGHHFQLQFALLSSSFFLLEVSAISLRDDTGNDDYLTSSTTTVLQAVVISSLAFLAVLVVVVVKCTDCYNSEVSSESHPACSNTTDYKWGGAEGYTSASFGGDVAFRSGETVEMTQQQSLPYTMIPTNVPSSAGFQGYNAVGEAGDGPPPGATGYQGSVRSNSSYGDSRHYNPVAPQDPPPAYEAPTYNASSYGNR